jgi:two-component system sensor histidine kinase AlgZ
MRAELTPFMDRPAPSSPVDTLLRPEGLLSLLLLGQGLALVLALAPGAGEGRLIYFGLASLAIQWVSLLTLAGLYLGRRWLVGRSEGLVTAVILGLLTAATWFTGGLAWVILGPGGEPDLLTFLAKLTGIAWTLGLLGTALLLGAWRWHQMSLQIQLSRLEALQARIRPHFLFNTLNTGAALVHARPEQAEQLLLDLADLFRAALSGPQEIALRDELALTRRYLEIEGLRFGPRLQVNWDLPEQLPALVVPSLSVQPLVENAIRHGVEPSAGGGRIDIGVRLEGAQLLIVVENDLPPTGATPAIGHQVGLVSARERIHALTRGRGRLDSGAVGGRYVATVRLPLDAG